MQPKNAFKLNDKYKDWKISISKYYPDDLNFNTNKEFKNSKLLKEYNGINFDEFQKIFKIHEITTKPEYDNINGIICIDNNEFLKDDDYLPYYLYCSYKDKRCIFELSEDVIKNTPEDGLKDLDASSITSFSNPKNKFKKTLKDVLKDIIEDVSKETTKEILNDLIYTLEDRPITRSNIPKYYKLKLHKAEVIDDTSNAKIYVYNNIYNTYDNIYDKEFLYLLENGNIKTHNEYFINYIENILHYINENNFKIQIDESYSNYSFRKYLITINKNYNTGISRYNKMKVNKNYSRETLAKYERVKKTIENHMYTLIFMKQPKQKLKYVIVDDAEYSGFEFSLDRIHNSRFPEILPYGLNGRLSNEVFDRYYIKKDSQNIIDNLLKIDKQTRSYSHINLYNLLYSTLEFSDFKITFGYSAKQLSVSIDATKSTKVHNIIAINHKLIFEIEKDFNRDGNLKIIEKFDEIYENSFSSIYGDEVKYDIPIYDNLDFTDMEYFIKDNIIKHIVEIKNKYKKQY